MPLKIIRDDITKVACDAIVNAANNSLLGGGGVDGAIHRAAGPQLLEECRTLKGCETGQAKITKGYNLPAKYVIHTVGPVYNDGLHGEEELLKSCYRNSLKLAVENNCESLAFPLISAGAYGYPGAEALEVAQNTIIEFLEDQDLMVYIVVFDKSSFKISSELVSAVEEFIDDKYVENNIIFQSEKLRNPKFFFNDFEKSSSYMAAYQFDKAAALVEEDHYENVRKTLGDKAKGLEEVLKCIDESFVQMLFRKIDEKKLTDAAVYKKANIDRRLFSKIRSDIHYKPSKPTAVALAIALELPLDETKEFLMKAGFALSRSNKFDLIIEYFISNGIYNVHQINTVLFEFDQSLLGYYKVA